MNPRWLRNGLVWLLVLVAALAVFFNLFSQTREVNTISLTELARQVREGDVKSISISGEDLVIKFGDGSTAVSRKEQGVDITETLSRLGVTEEQLQAVEIGYEAPSELGSWLGLLTSLLPVLLIGGLFLFMMRQAQAGNNQALSFGRSRARVFSGDRPTINFNDVAGADEAKQELQEVVEFLKEPERFSALGARIPKGVLMVGPPGCGKTLMARAVAGEANVPFFSISGSEFVEMFVGVGAARVRDLFEQAKRSSPCLIFIDEVDAVGRHRGAGLGGSHDEREQTLNQILVEMDGFDTDTNVIVIAATNRPDILDPALLRPGRFDRQVVLDRPDMRGRRSILDIHVRGKPIGEDANLDVVAKETPGFSGADLENVVNEAAILAARRNRKAIAMKDLQEAVERVMAGPERRSRVISPEEKKIIAYHEAGHAVVMKMLPNCDPVHKISVVARGMALGYTMPLPQDDRYLMSKSKFEDELAGLLGGRAAEEIVFNDITTGAANDLERATTVARKMVTEFGMSEKLGPLTFGKKEELVFLGKEIGEQRNYSEQVAQDIDEEVRAIINRAYHRAKDVLTQSRHILERLAQKLLEVETLEGADLQAVFEGEPIPAPQPA